MATTKLTKVGNSTAVFIPSSVRNSAGVVVGDSFQVESPRPGVIVLTSSNHEQASRLAQLEEAEKHIRTRSERFAEWPSGMDAETFLEESKEEKADGLLSR